MTVKRLNLYHDNLQFGPDRMGCHGKDGHVKEAGFFGRNIQMDDGQRFNRGSLVDFLNTAQTLGMIGDNTTQLSKWDVSKAADEKIQNLYQQFMNKRLIILAQRKQDYQSATATIDSAEKQKLLEQAAKGGHPEAQYELAEILIKDKTTRLAAVDWYRAAANQEHLLAIAAYLKWDPFMASHAYDTIVLNRHWKGERASVFTRLVEFVTPNLNNYQFVINPKYANVSELLTLSLSCHDVITKFKRQPRQYGYPGKYVSDLLSQLEMSYKAISKQCFFEELNDQKPKLNAHVLKYRKDKLEKKQQEITRQKEILSEVEQVKGHLQTLQTPNSFSQNQIKKCEKQAEDLLAQIESLNREAKEIEISIAQATPPSKEELLSFCAPQILKISADLEPMKSREARRYRLACGTDTKPSMRDRVLNALYELWQEALKPSV